MNFEGGIILYLTLTLGVWLPVCGVLGCLILDGGTTLYVMPTFGLDVADCATIFMFATVDRRD